MSLAHHLKILSKYIETESKCVYIPDKDKRAIMNGTLSQNKFDQLVHDLRRKWCVGTIRDIYSKPKPSIDTGGEFYLKKIPASTDSVFEAFAEGYVFGLYHRYVTGIKSLGNLIRTFRKDVSINVPKDVSLARMVQANGSQEYKAQFTVSSTGLIDFSRYARMIGKSAFGTRVELAALAKEHKCEVDIYTKEKGRPYTLQETFKPGNTGHSHHMVLTLLESRATNGMNHYDVLIPRYMHTHQTFWAQFAQLQPPASTNQRIGHHENNNGSNMSNLKKYEKNLAYHV